MDVLCAGTVSPEMLTLKGVLKVFEHGGACTGESSEGAAACQGCLWVLLPLLQVNPSPGEDQMLFIWVAVLVPCSRQGWGSCRFPPGMCGGSGCTLSLGLAIPGVQVGSAPSSSAQGWMGRSIYPFL